MRWPPVEYRIKFKIAATTFSIHQFGEPVYLASLLHDNVPARSLRSSDKSLLDVPRRRTEPAKRLFSFAAPTIWNCLPVHFRQLDPIAVGKSSFKKQLKTLVSTLPTHSELDLSPRKRIVYNDIWRVINFTYIHTYIHTRLCKKYGGFMSNHFRVVHQRGERQYATRCISSKNYWS